MPARILLRRDSSGNWDTNNPVLSLGEPGVETDTLKVKIGDGTSDWQSLDYSITKDFSDLTNTPTTISGYGITDALSLDAISVTQTSASGSGSLTYDSQTGTFTYTPPVLATTLDAVAENGNTTDQPIVARTFQSDVIFKNSNSVDEPITVQTGENANSTGPLTVNSTVTVEDGARWVII
jgi:hypothetical protein